MPRNGTKAQSVRCQTTRFRFPEALEALSKVLTAVWYRG